MTAPAQPTSAMPVPAVDLDAARTTAERLRRTGRLGAQSLARLEQTAPQGWAGGASEAYHGQRSRAAERADLLAGLARSVSAGIDRYVDDVQAALAGMRGCAADLERALVRQAAVVADPTPGVEAAAHAEVDDVWRRYEEHRRRYDLAVLNLTDELESLPDFAGRPRSFSEHIGDAVETWVERGLVEPAAALGGAVATLWADPTRTDDLIRALVDGWRQQVHHPVETGRDTVGWEYWEGGQYGHGVGALASVVGGSLIRKALKGLNLPEHWERNVANKDAPMPRVQTVDEMLAGVDLEAHEHYYLGHTIRRHVNVDEEYQIDRLENGTLTDDLRRGNKPPEVSQWNDLETAEREITEVLREHELAVTEFALGSGKPYTLRLRGRAPAMSGTVLYPDGNDGYLTQPSRDVLVVLTREHGTLHILTAYLEKPKP